MTRGLTIPGVQTVHPREVWEPWSTHTVASLDPPSQKPGSITRPVSHYTASDDLIDGDPGEHAGELPKFIGGIQTYYAAQRGYSVGYLFAIDWLGGVWELRGFDYMSAANKGHNGYTAPILMLVDGNDPVTIQAATSARAVWREFRRRSGRPDFEGRPWGHGELYKRTGIGTPTSCPGTGIQNQINSGVLDLDRDTGVVHPPPPPQITDNRMYYVVRDKGQTIWSIATNLYLNGSVKSNADAIVAANGGSDIIHVGDKLVLPGLVEPGEYYGIKTDVQQGETSIWGIAQEVYVSGNHNDNVKLIVEEHGGTVIHTGKPVPIPGRMIR